MFLPGKEAYFLPFLKSIKKEKSPRVRKREACIQLPFWRVSIKAIPKKRTKTATFAKLIGKV